jgi:WD40 repeat protein
VGLIFISHSSLNNAQAVRVRDWLREQGWKETFLDLDPEHGLAPGQKWQEELKRAGESCSAVVVLVSPEWAASKWCLTEFLLASQLNKRIFPVIIKPTPFKDLPLELIAHFQLADISEPTKETDGFERLRHGLMRAGLDPKDFPWPPPREPGRRPYRGLRTMEEEDAAIFFGRDAAITKGLDALRRMRGGAPDRMLVVLGASGAGKSSFLRAGLISRLRRDNENFIVLPVVRPERAAMTGPSGVLHSLGVEKGASPAALAERFAAIRKPVVENFRRLAQAANETWTERRPLTLVLPIDQGEEFFAAENAETTAAFDLLAAAFAADPDLVAVLTIRSDSFEQLQGETRLGNIPRQPFDLPRLSPSAFKEVIEGPGRLASPPIAVEPALSDRLVKDLDAADALPLLAFTLERLVADYGADGKLALNEYEQEMGGLAGAIGKAVEAAFVAAAADPTLPKGRAELEGLARGAFIPWLVRVDDIEVAPKRRVARLSELPEASRALVAKFIDQRLLVSDMIKDGEVTVEVSHEAVLRNWGLLAAWIAGEREVLGRVERLMRAAREWSGGAPSERSLLLVHRGERLASAEALLEREDIRRLMAPATVTYLDACRQQEQRERRRVAARRVVTAGGGLALAGVFAVAIGFGVQAIRSDSSARSMSIDFLKSRAENEVAKGRYARGARYALAGLRVAPFRTDDFWPVLASAMFLPDLNAGILPDDEAPRDRVFSPDGRFVLTDNRSRTGLELFFSNANLRPLATITGAYAVPPTAVFSADSARLVNFTSDGFVSVWRTSDGKRLKRVNFRSIEPEDIVVSPDGARLAIIGASGGVSLHSTDDLRRIAVLAAPAPAPQQDAGGLPTGFAGFAPAVAFSQDGSRVAVGVRGVITIFRASDASVVATAKWPGTAIINLVFSRDGARLLTGGDNGIAREWSSADGAQLAAYGEARGNLWKVGYSPDGATLILNYETRAELWAQADRKRRVVLVTDDEQIADFAFSRDGSRIATADYTGKAQLWDTENGRLVAELGSQFGEVYGIQFGSLKDEVFIESADLGTKRVNVSALMVPLQDLVRDACNTLLGSEDRYFTQQEIDSEAALRMVWPSSDQNICEGEVELRADPGRVVRPQPARPARPLDAGRAAFDGTLSLCARMSVANAPPTTADGMLESYSPLVKVGGVTLAVAPAPGACLSGGFGVRDRRLHKGLDFMEGGPIVAGGDGRIAEMKYRADYGNMVLIDHGHDVFTRYAHLESFETGLAVGGQVALGQAIGTMGNTADYAIPMQLHYELLLGDYDGPKASFGLTPHSPFEYPPAN